MVGTDPVEVEQQLVEGALACPGCVGVLRPWGHARWRTCREERGSRAAPPSPGELLGLWEHARAAAGLGSGAPRGRGVGDRCGVAGQGCWRPGHRVIAAALGRPACTVRGWLRRFTACAEDVRVLFTGLLHALDPAAAPLPAGGSVLVDAVEALGRAAAAAVLRLGPCPVWEFASTATGGRLLAPPAQTSREGVVANTS